MFIYIYIYISKDNSPQISPLQQEAKALMETADVSIEADGSDGAFPNILYETWREVCPQSTDGDTKRLLQLCGNHLVHISEVLVELVLGKDCNTHTG